MISPILLKNIQGAMLFLWLLEMPSIHFGPYMVSISSLIYWEYWNNIAQVRDSLLRFHINSSVDKIIISSVFLEKEYEILKFLKLSVNGVSILLIQEAYQKKKALKARLIWKIHMGKTPKDQAGLSSIRLNRLMQSRLFNSLFKVSLHRRGYRLITDYLIHSNN